MLRYAWRQPNAIQGNKKQRRYKASWDRAIHCTLPYTQSVVQGGGLTQSHTASCMKPVFLHLRIYLFTVSTMYSIFPMMYLCQYLQNVSTSLHVCSIAKTPVSDTPSIMVGFRAAGFRRFEHQSSVRMSDVFGNQKPAPSFQISGKSCSARISTHFLTLLLPKFIFSFSFMDLMS